jgi:hypothetical protein
MTNTGASMGGGGDKLYNDMASGYLEGAEFTVHRSQFTVRRSAYGSE